MLVLASCAARTSTNPTSRSSTRLAPATTLSPATTAYTVGSRVWVDVSVATLWTSTTAPRPIDAKALAAPVDIRGWLAAMSTSVRRGLMGRVETQVLYGDPLIVTAVQTGWLRVVAPGQPTHRDRRGYPGWLPKRQVTTRAPVATRTVATVTGSTTTWLRTAAGSRLVEISIGTRLPVLSVTGSKVVVASPTHVRLTVAASAVVVRSVGTPALARTRSAVVA